MFHRPILAVEILAATFLTTLLTLAMPLYVIQILNRYVSYGFHGTLITLTIGMLIAVILQFGFRIVRTKMATTINQEPNDRLSRDILSIISRAKAEPLDQLSKPRLHEALNQVQTIQQSYDAQTMTAVLDAPFSLIFIGVIYLLSPVLAGITLLGIFLALFFGWLTILKSQKNSELLLQSLSEHRNLNSSAVNALETVRAFVGTSFLFKKWDTQLSAISRLKNKLTDYKELSQTMTMTGSSLTSVFLYAAGAVLVVQGELSVGALIGANILCGKAYQNTTRLVQTAFSLTRAKQAFKDLELLKRIPLEASTGSALTSYQGQIEFQDLGFSYPNTSGPLFESLTLRLAPGNVMAVFGGNGTGKTT
ncbi:MAG: ABC transporter, partial [Proteobacteria bacterium]|nr:ABC transporter [Pseudomonadota bacterium]